MGDSHVPDVDVWIGLDVGKGDHHAWVLDDAGDDLFDRAIRNDQEALEQLIADAQKHGRPALVIDQPGSIAQLALAVARTCEVPVAYVPGLVMRRASQLYPGEAKTDPRDSFVIADTARMQRKRVAWLDVNDDLLEQLRVLVGYDEDLAHDATRTSNRIRDALCGIHPALERVVGPRLDHKAVRALLAKWPTPTALRNAGRTKVAQLLKPLAPRMGERLTLDLFSALYTQTLTLPAEDTYGRVIAELAGELDRIHMRRDSLLEEIEELFSAHPCGPVLASLPGIGPRTGPRILVEIGDGSRFPTGGHLASYAGLAPVTRQSGTTLKAEARSRRGNHRLKNALFQAAFASLRRPESRRYYDRKRSEGKRHNAAVIALARRRCDVILAMLRTNTPYRTPTDDSAETRAA